MGNINYTLHSKCCLGLYEREHMSLMREKITQYGYYQGTDGDNYSSNCNPPGRFTAAHLKFMLRKLPLRFIFFVLALPLSKCFIIHRRKLLRMKIFIFVPMLCFWRLRNDAYWNHWHLTRFIIKRVCVVEFQMIIHNLPHFVMVFCGFLADAKGKQDFYCKTSLSRISKCEHLPRARGLRHLAANFNIQTRFI